jgi:hypothetical protein
MRVPKVTEARITVFENFDSNEQRPATTRRVKRQMLACNEGILKEKERALYGQSSVGLLDFFKASPGMLDNEDGESDNHLLFKREFLLLKLSFFRQISYILFVNFS